MKFDIIASINKNLLWMYFYKELKTYILPEMGSSYTWCNFTRVTPFLSHRFPKDLTVKKIALNAN